MAYGENLVAGPVVGCRAAIFWDWTGDRWADG